MPMMMEVELESDTGLQDEIENEQQESEATEAHESTADLPESTEQPAAEVDPVVEQPESEIISDGVAEWELACRNLERQISDLTIERAELSDRAKSTKKRIDCLAEELSDLRSDGPQPIRRTPPRQEECNPAVQLDCDQAPAPPSVDDKAWRSVSINELAKHSLKSSMAEKLMEAGLETIGQLEDLRADISNGRAKWPKGIGPAKITMIEDSVIAWLSANRDAAVLREAQHSPPVERSWEGMDGTEQVDFILKQAEEINTGETGCLDRKHPDSDQFWQSGAEYQKRGDELRHCPYVPGPEMDDWIRGFLGMAALDKYEKSRVIGDSPISSKAACSIDLMDL